MDPTSQPKITRYDSNGNPVSDDYAKNIKTTSTSTSTPAPALNEPVTNPEATSVHGTGTGPTMGGKKYKKSYKKGGSKKHKKSYKKGGSKKHKKSYKNKKH